MRLPSAFLVFGSFALLLTACGPGDDTGGGGGSGTTTSTSSGTGGGADCAVGARAAKTLDSAGGTVSLCGASVTVPAGALAASREVAVEIVTPAVSAPVDEAFLDRVYRFTPDDAALPAQATISLPKDPADTHYQDLAYLDPTQQTWNMIESCPVGDALTIATARLGTWAILRDVNAYPASSLGLGEATVQIDFLGASHDFAVGMSGYAIYETLSGSDTRSVYLDLWRTGASGMEHLDLRMGDSPTSRDVLEIDFFDEASNVIWSYLQPVDGPATKFDVLRDADGRLHGSFTVDLHTMSLGTQTMTGTLDVQPVRYRFPPDAACGG